MTTAAPIRIYHSRSRLKKECPHLSGVPNLGTISELGAPKGCQRFNHREDSGRVLTARRFNSAIAPDLDRFHPLHSPSRFPATQGCGDDACSSKPSDRRTSRRASPSSAGSTCLSRKRKSLSSTGDSCAPMPIRTRSRRGRVSSSDSTITSRASSAISNGSAWSALTATRNGVRSFWNVSARPASAMPMCRSS